MKKYKTKYEQLLAQKRQSISDGDYESARECDAILTWMKKPKKFQKKNEKI